MTPTPATLAKDAVDQMFAALDNVLIKGAAHCAAQGVDEAVYLGWRLTPDMFPLARQVRIATDIATRSLSRLAGEEPPSFPDDETSFAELRTRVARSREIVARLASDAIDANPDGEVDVPRRGKVMTYKRADFLRGFILPNLYFHVTAAYMLLRQLGVNLGKSDYLGEGEV